MAKSIVLKLDGPEEIHTFLLVSSVPDYRLAWNLNNALGIRLTERTGISKEIHKATVNFNCFNFPNVNSEWQVYLLTNKNRDGILIPAFKQFDYILILSGEDCPLNPLVLNKQLLGLSVIIATKYTQEGIPKDILNKILYS